MNIVLISLVIYISIFILLMALVPYVHTDELDEDLPLTERNYGTNCAANKNYLDIVIAATLDGSIIALDGRTGEFMWDYKESPLIQGTLTNSGPIDIAGTSLQLIPTLDGRLFSYAHHSNLIEPLPITVESLLESTLRLGRDAVSGGKTVSTAGLNLITGDKKYECTIDSCQKNDESSFLNYPTLLIKRVSNSIRANDASEGTERWNLSTCEIEISLSEVESLETDLPRKKFALRPPDGFISARSKDNYWSYNIDGHIVNVWHILGNSIHDISLFDPANIVTTQYEVGYRHEQKLPAQSSLFYMGTYNGFPFIIQSPKSKKILKKKLADFDTFDLMKEITSPKLCSAESVRKGIAYEVENMSLLMLLHRAYGKTHTKMIEDKSLIQDRGNLAIVAHKSNGARNKGVFLIGTDNIRSTSHVKDGDHGYLVLDEPSTGGKEIPSFFSLVMRRIASLSQYCYTFLIASVFGFFIKRFKEVSGSHVSDSSSCLNVSDSSSDEAIELLRPSLRAIPEASIETVDVPNNERKRTTTKSSDDQKTEDVKKESKKKKALGRERTKSSQSTEIFRSQFEEKFEVQKILGRGGFGIVFCAKDILDDTMYAVKRIATNDKDTAELVLRECRALAVFDHPGIIRYFFTWREEPPKGYQKEKDRELFKRLKIMRRIRKKTENNNGLSVTWEEVNDESLKINEIAPVFNRRTTSESGRALYNDEESAGFTSNSGANRVREEDSSESSSNSSSQASTDVENDSYCDSDKFNNARKESNQTSDDDIIFYGSGDKEMSVQSSGLVVKSDNDKLELRQLRPEEDHFIYTYIVMQLCDGTLEQWLKSDEAKLGRDIKVIKDYIRQIAEAVAYIHGKGYIHRDLKPGNIFFYTDSNNKKILKIGDMGLVTNSDRNHVMHSKRGAQVGLHTKDVGTRSYMSPEQINNKEYTTKVDDFALGLIATELIINFETTFEKAQVFRDYQYGRVPNILEKYPEAKEFLMALTREDPIRRLSSAEAAKHPFLCG